MTGIVLVQLSLSSQIAHIIMEMSRKQGGTRVGLEWQLGEHDPRFDKRYEIALVAFLVGFSSLIFYMIYDLMYHQTNDLGRLACRTTAIGFWLLLISGIVGLRLYRRNIKVNVTTRVDLTPTEVRDRLKASLSEAVKRHEVVRSNQNYFGQMFRFKVKMDWKKRATIILHSFVPDDPDTRIEVRSNFDYDDWWYLKGLIENAFDDVVN